MIRNQTRRPVGGMHRQPGNCHYDYPADLHGDNQTQYSSGSRQYYPQHHCYNSQQEYNQDYREAAGAFGRVRQHQPANHAHCYDQQESYNYAPDHEDDHDDDVATYLSAGNMEWDVSNLYSEGCQHRYMPSIATTPSRYQPRRPQQAERSLYPSTFQIEVVPQIDIDHLMHKTAFSGRRPGNNMVQPQSHRNHMHYHSNHMHNQQPQPHHQDTYFRDYQRQHDDYDDEYEQQYQYRSSSTDSVSSVSVTSRYTIESGRSFGSRQRQPQHGISISARDRWGNASSKLIDGPPLSPYNTAAYSPAVPRKSFANNQRQRVQHMSHSPDQHSKHFKGDTHVRRPSFVPNKNKKEVRGMEAKLKDPSKYGDDDSYNPVSCLDEKPTTQVTIEVSPGAFLPLRGSQETLEAYNSGHSHLMSCMGCSLALRCVPDCQIVICPECRFMSPIEATDNGSRAGLSEGYRLWRMKHHGAAGQGGGVGLGLRV